MGEGGGGRAGEKEPKRRRVKGERKVGRGFLMAGSCHRHVAAELQVSAARWSCLRGTAGTVV